METCEIVYEEVKWGLINSKYKFWASAIGPQGSYNAGSSPVFKNERTFGPSSTDKQSLNAHNALIQKLIKDGWESTGDRGTAWFNYRFRRQVK